MQKPAFTAFTLVASGGRLREIISDAEISLPFDPKVDTVHPAHFPIKALWDTGATNCAITKKIADQIGLSPTGQAEVHHANGVTLEDTYLINVALPNRIEVPLVKATECKSAGTFDLIIGMDIITMGDFAVTNEGGISVVSYRYPALKHIDYVKDFNTIYGTKTAGVGRNDPCPCGSGLKFKKCHGKVGSPNPN